MPGTLLAESQPFAWHGYLSWTMLALAFACALAILVDELVLGHRQHMWIMNLVYPITALYWGPVALWFYVRHGRRHEPEAEEVRWTHVTKADTHCGAGCTLGDSPDFWFQMQIGMVLGFFTSYPVNRWLLRRGLKEKM